MAFSYFNVVVKVLAILEIKACWKNNSLHLLRRTLTLQIYFKKYSLLICSSISKSVLSYKSNFPFSHSWYSTVCYKAQERMQNYCYKLRVCFKYLFLFCFGCFLGSHYYLFTVSNDACDIHNPSGCQTTYFFQLYSIVGSALYMHILINCHPLLLTIMFRSFQSTSPGWSTAVASSSCQKRIYNSRSI